MSLRLLPLSFNKILAQKRMDLIMTITPFPDDACIDTIFTDGTIPVLFAEMSRGGDALTRSIPCNHTIDTESGLCARARKAPKRHHMNTPSQTMAEWLGKSIGDGNEHAWLPGLCSDSDDHHTLSSERLLSHAWLGTRPSFTVIPTQQPPLTQQLSTAPFTMGVDLFSPLASPVPSLPTTSTLNTLTQPSSVTAGAHSSLREGGTIPMPTLNSSRIPIAVSDAIVQHVISSQKDNTVPSAVTEDSWLDKLAAVFPCPDAMVFPKGAPNVGTLRSIANDINDVLKTTAAAKRKATLETLRAKRTHVNALFASMELDALAQVRMPSSHVPSFVHAYYCMRAVQGR